MTKVLSIIAGIGFVLIGLIQFAAVYTFFREHWGWWFIFAGPAALVFGYTPFLGSFLAVIAAQKVWGWSSLFSILLFFWPAVLQSGLMIFAVILESFKKK